MCISYYFHAFQASSHSPFPLAQAHLKHINDSNKFGQGGRLALSFGRLANELWSTEKNSLSPKAFFAELTACRSQFAGHQQQDAHEFLEVLLDRLSEDLNLVDDKVVPSRAKQLGKQKKISNVLKYPPSPPPPTGAQPYIEQPDSDGRPDAELADIWWSNHFKRDSSIVQSLFAGQFKTVTTCSCGYSSDRYEVFTSLSLSIPEEAHRVLCVHVLARHVPYSIQVLVRVRRDGDLAAVAAALLAPTLDPPLQGLYPAHAAHKDGDAAPSNGHAFPPVFVGAKVVQSRVTALCPMSRRISTIKDSDFLFFFQLSHEAAPSPSPSPAPTPNPAEAEDEEDEEFDEEEEEEEEEEEDTPAQPAKESRRRNFVIFIQRKVQAHSSGAVDFFRMEPFGLPFVEEMLPLRGALSGRHLYEMVHGRVRIFFKSQPHVHSRGAPTTPPRAGNGSAGSAAEDSASSALPCTPEFHKLSPFPPLQPQGHATNGRSAAAAAQSLLASTDDLVGGPVPEFGFVLRRVAGGAQGGVMCSRCPWLSRCQGCVIPLDEGCVADKHSAVVLRDGESLAIDWHRIVFEELLDTAAAIEMRKHVPVGSPGAANKPTETHLPLSCCLDKFTEEDRISDFVCPTCKRDDRMKRGFSLWRCPPILVVQLKRFQYDRTSRRKLNNRVDFPIDGLDMTKYLAKARLGDLDRDGQPPPMYDLFANIHHVGLLGGGHYVAAIRQDKGGNKDGPQFSIYNDGLVSNLADTNEVASNSAYVLFYRRRDLAGLPLSSLFPAGDAVDRASKGGGAGPQASSTGMREKMRNLVSGTRKMRIAAEDANTATGGEEDAGQAAPTIRTPADCTVA